VLVSSHLLTEVQQSADRVVILSQGRLVREGSVVELEQGAGVTVVARTPTLDKLGNAIAAAGGSATRSGPDELRVQGIDAPTVGHAAFEAGVELHELRTERADLEQLFFQLTEGEFHAQGVPPGAPPGAVPGAPPGQPGMPPAQHVQTTPGGAR
jgi:ABC-2 type transport system ATP-binding protein